jgi:hypothetical protein
MASTTPSSKDDGDKPAASKSAPDTAPDVSVAGDSQVTHAPVHADVVVSDAASPAFSTKPSDVPADPRTGRPFETSHAGLKGQDGVDALNAAGTVVPGVDPDRIPAEVTPGVSPDAGGDRLFAAALAKAPSLTREFIDRMGLTDEYLGQIARGEVPPPPTPGPLHTADMYLTPGGFQQTPPGVKPADVGGNAVTR